MPEWCTCLLLYLVRPLPTPTSRQHMVLSSVMLSHAWTGFLVKLGLFIFTIVILLFWMGRNAAFLLILLNTSSVRIVHGCAHITGTFSRNFLRRYNQYMIPYYIAVHIFLDLVWIQNNRALRTFQEHFIFLIKLRRGGNFSKNFNRFERDKICTVLRTDSQTRRLIIVNGK